MAHTTIDDRPVHEYLALTSFSLVMPAVLFLAPILINIFSAMPIHMV